MVRSLEYFVTRFSEWVLTVAVPTTTEIMDKMEVKVSRKMFAWKDSQSLNSESLLVEQFGAIQIFQVLRTFLVVHTYAMKEGWILELFSHLFCERKSHVTLLTNAEFLQLGLDNSQAKSHTSYEMSVPATFETQHYYHPMALLSREV